MPNQTQSDAYFRVFDARLESLAHSPSMEYLVKLREELSKWQEEIAKEIDSNEKAYQKALHGADL